MNILELLISVWTFFQVNILTQPAFFLGIIVFVGYLLLGRPVYDALAGFIKATVGYLVLNVAAGGLVGNFRPILAGLKERFNLSAVVIDPYFGQTAAQQAIEGAGRSFSLMVIVLLIAFMVNIVLVIFRKYTKVRTVFITGHIMVQQSSTALWLVLFAFPELQDAGVIVMLGLLLGTYWSVFSNLTVEATQDLTEGGGFAIGHQQMFGVWLTDKFAGKFSKNSKKLEDVTLPGFLSIFKESVVSTSILMFLFFGIIMGILGKDLMMTIDATYTGERNYVFYILEKSLVLRSLSANFTTGCPYVRIRIDGILPRYLQQTVAWFHAGNRLRGNLWIRTRKCRHFRLLVRSFGTILGDHRFGCIQEPGSGHHRIRTCIL